MHRATYVGSFLMLGSAFLLMGGCDRSGSGSPTSRTSAPIAELIIALTPRCAAEVRRLMRKDARKKVLVIGIDVLPDCIGFQYALALRESPPADGVILTVSEGIPLAIDRDDAEFLKGTSLDYKADHQGFEFINPREDTSLLREYQEKAATEARMRPLEEARAKTIDPARAVEDLLTPRRQEAFDDLQLWWKFHQPEVYSGPDEIGRVDCYQLADGSPITVVFTGEPEEQDGGIHLIQASGHLIPIFQGHDYLDDDDQFVDVNGDGLPEIVSFNTMGAKDDENPKKIVRDASFLIVLPITPKQVPLLSILFDTRPVSGAPTWRWTLAESPSGTRDVVLEQQDAKVWKERARYRWSLQSGRYEGPGGSRDEKFLAVSGKLEEGEINAFMAP